MTLKDWILKIFTQVHLDGPQAEMKGEKFGEFKVLSGQIRDATS